MLKKAVYLQKTSTSIINTQQEIPFIFSPIKEIKAILTAKESTLVPVGSLKEILRVLFPRKAIFFDTKEDETLIVHCIPEGPFGPDPEVFLDHFLPDFLEIVAGISEKLNLTEVSVLGYSPVGQPELSRIQFINSLTSKNRTKIILNLYELYILYQAVINNKNSENCFVSIFINDSHKFCFFTSRETTLKQLCKKEPVIEQHLKEDPGSGLINPLVGTKYQLTDKVGEKNIELVCLTGGGQSISFGNTGLFGFPFFNKKLRLRYIDDSEPAVHPCQNCLACVRFCPADLHPAYLYHNLLNQDYEEAKSLAVQKCTLCGRCSFVCPSSLPLTSTIEVSLQKMAEEENEQD